MYKEIIAFMLLHAASVVGTCVCVCTYHGFISQTTHASLLERSVKESFMCFFFFFVLVVCCLLVHTLAHTILQGFWKLFRAMTSSLFGESVCFVHRRHHFLVEAGGARGARAAW